MTRLRDKVRVVPLDTGRLARVEESVLAAAREENVLAAAREAGRRSPTRPRRATAIAWTAGAALAAAVALLLVGRGDPRPVGDPARVDLGDAAILLTPGSRAAVRSRPDGARLVELATGRVDCEVEPRSGRAPFIVQAGDVTVEVVGTVFSVERAATGDDVKVAVSRGVVGVAARGRPPVKVAAGQRWSRRVDEVVASSGSQPNTSPEAERGAHGAEQRLAAGAAAPDPSGGLAGADPTARLEGQPGDRGRPGDRGPPGSRGRPGNRDDDGADPTGGRSDDDGADRPDAPDGTAQPRDDGDRDGHSGDRDGQSGDRDGKSGDRDDQSGERDGQSGDRDGQSGDRDGQSGDRDGQSDDRGVRGGDRGGQSGDRGVRGGDRGGRSGDGGVRGGDRDAAAPDDLPPLTCEDVDLCRRAALGSVGPSAGEALYSLIYIELFREKDPGQAITLAELYERRFARRRAREAEAVLWLRVIAHGAAGEPTARREAARRYLERHPRGRFSTDAAHLLGE